VPTSPESALAAVMAPFSLDSPNTPALPPSIHDICLSTNSPTEKIPGRKKALAKSIVLKKEKKLSSIKTEKISFSEIEKLSSKSPSGKRSTPRSTDSPKSSRSPRVASSKKKSDLQKRLAEQPLSVSSSPSVSSNERKRKVDGKSSESSFQSPKKGAIASSPATTRPESIEVAGLSGLDFLKFPSEIFDTYNSGNWVKLEKVLRTTFADNCDFETKYTGVKPETKPDLDYSTKGLDNVIAWLRDLADYIPDIIFRIEEKKLRKVGNLVKILCKYSAHGTPLYSLGATGSKLNSVSTGNMLHKTILETKPFEKSSAPIDPAFKDIFAKEPADEPVKEPNEEPVKEAVPLLPASSWSSDCIAMFPIPEMPFRVEQMPSFDSVGTLTMSMNADGKIASLNMIWATQNLGNPEY
jgi:hypothetical protein